MTLESPHSVTLAGEPQLSQGESDERRQPMFSGDRRYPLILQAIRKMHGWDKADARIANRLWAEIHLFEDFPTSQEYLATTQKKE